MEKIIEVGGKQIKAKSTAASLLRYKANFGQDGLRDFIALATDVQEGKISYDTDFTVFYRFLWVFAKAADPELPPLEEWMDGFDIPPLDFIMEALPQTVPLLSTGHAMIKPKN